MFTQLSDSPVYTDTKQSRTLWNGIFQREGLNVRKAFVHRKPRWFNTCQAFIICHECFQASAVLPVIYRRKIRKVIQQVRV